MDFARKQLEKYGWTDGKGLGKNENGISQALKPKLKRSVTGIGHDPASEFNEHWWKALYDKAASNVEVQEKKGKTKKIITKDDFKITNSTWQINRSPATQTKEQYSDYFVRKAVIDGSKMENITDGNSEEEKDTKDVYKMTDEELFVACEGRTAHKGARHGLKALGKLARIAQQEEMLLSQEKYNGYSHSKKRNVKSEQVIEEMSLDTGDIVELKKKKKKEKRKCCISNENQIENNSVAKSQESMVHGKIKSNNNVAIVIEKDKVSKSKTSQKYTINEEFNKDADEFIEKPKTKRKRKVKDNEEEIVNLEIDNNDNKIKEIIIVKKKKRRKNEDDLS